jgi:hypothetical protein
MKAMGSWLANSEFSARKRAVILVLILIIVGLQSALSALSQPFWYDEILTAILCRLPSLLAIWGALHNAADTHPPGFFVLAWAAHRLIADDHLALRLPSILGLLLTVCCVYFILSRRLPRLTGLVGAAFVLCTDLTPYSYEARPYALMVGCIAAAVLAWQRVEDSRIYSAGLAISLAAAASLHYYAIFVWPAFIFAELTVWIIHRRFRFAVWVSFVVGASPLVLFAGLLRAMVVAYGQNFWAQPHFKQMYFTYNNLLNVDSHWGVVFAIGITAVALWPNLVGAQTGGSVNDLRKKPSSVPLEEKVLALVLLWLPIIAVTAAMVSHGGLTERHMLPAILGCALTLGYGLENTPGAARLLLLILFLVNYEAFSAPILRDVARGDLLARREAAEHEITALAARLHNPDLPIVIGSELDYLPIAYYTPNELRARVHVLVDPKSAVRYLNTASGDLNLLVIQHYYPLQVDDFDGFVASHREFYLVAGEDFDWLMPRLVDDGDVLRLVATGEDGESPVYDVGIGPKNSSE